MNIDVDGALEALGDPTRRRIIGRLASGPLDVKRISEGMPVGRSAVSMHLRALKDAGLVADRPVGNRRLYHLRREGLRQLRDHFDWYWERSLSAYGEAAETRAREQNMTIEQEVIVAKTERVRAPLAVAFEVFIEQKWWPVRTHHLAEPPGREVVLEPFVGGRWYERATDGTETDWGTVLAWQPPYRLLLTWQVSPKWTYEEDPGRASEIEVTFTPEGPHLTRVDFVHRRLERYGRHTKQMRRILEEKGGGPLRAFAKHIAKRRAET